MKAKNENPIGPFDLKVDFHANLNVYPTDIESQTPSESQIHKIFGDLHGNALKWLYLALKAGIVALSRHDYEMFGAIFKKQVDDITSEDIAKMEEIISNIQFICSKNTKVFLLGDELRDRVGNDLWNLMLLACFHKHLGENFNVNHSNHGGAFISAYQGAKTDELFEEDYEPTRQWNVFGQTMISLEILYKKGLVAKEKIKHIIENHYYPCLKVVNYSRITSQETGQEGLVIYTHAPTDLRYIQYLLENDLPQCFSSEKHDSETFVYAQQSANDLIESINKINKLAHDLVASGNYKTLALLRGYDSIIDSRRYEHLQRQQALLGVSYLVYWCHGHDIPKIKELNVIPLDDRLGKTLNLGVSPDNSEDSAPKNFKVYANPSPNPKEKLAASVLSKESGKAVVCFHYDDIDDDSILDNKNKENVAPKEKKTIKDVDNAEENPEVQVKPKRFAKRTHRKQQTQAQNLTLHGLYSKQSEADDEEKESTNNKPRKTK